MAQTVGSLNIRDVNGLKIGITNGSGTPTQFVSTATALRTLTLQDATGTMVLRDTTDTLTNKTLTGTTNNIDANTLRNGSVWSVGCSGSAPTSGQVLSYNGSNAIWQTVASSFPGTTTTSSILTTTDATSTVIDSVATANNTSYFLDIMIVGHRTDSQGEGAAFKIKAAYTRLTGAASIVRVGGSLDEQSAYSDDSTWNALTLGNTSNGTLEIRVNGAAAKTINWRSVVTVVQVA